LAVVVLAVRQRLMTVRLEAAVAAAVQANCKAQFTSTPTPQ
jgi:hypothetical protein